MKTWVSTDTVPEATVEALLSVIAYFRLPLKRAKKILGEVETPSPDGAKPAGCGECRPKAFWLFRSEIDASMVKSFDNELGGFLAWNDHGNLFEKIR